MLSEMQVLVARMLLNVIYRFPCVITAFDYLLSYTNEITLDQDKSVAFSSSRVQLFTPPC